MRNNMCISFAEVLCILLRYRHFALYRGLPIPFAFRSFCCLYIVNDNDLFCMFGTFAFVGR